MAGRCERRRGSARADQECRRITRWSYPKRLASIAGLYVVLGPWASDAAGYVSDEKVDVAACVGAAWVGGGVAGTIELLERSLAGGPRSRPGTPTADRRGEAGRAACLRASETKELDVKGPGLHGGLFVCVSLPLMSLGPRPAVPAIAGGAWVALLAVAAVLTWRRTGLRLAATAMAVGAAGMALFTRILMRTDDLFSAPAGELAAFFAAAVLGPVLLFAQSRTQPERWSRWRERSEGCTAVDMLLFRHIPDLRGEEPAAPGS